MIRIHILSNPRKDRVGKRARSLYYEVHGGEER
jgi:hypothetical protein